MQCWSVHILLLPAITYYPFPKPQLVLCRRRKYYRLGAVGYSYRYQSYYMYLLNTTRRVYDTSYVHKVGFFSLTNVDLGGINRTVLSWGITRVYMYAKDAAGVMSMIGARLDPGDYMISCEIIFAWSNQTNVIRVRDRRCVISGVANPEICIQYGDWNHSRSGSYLSV